MTSSALDSIDEATLAALPPDQKDSLLAELLRQQRQARGDDNRKVEDAVLILKLRPKIVVTTFNPITRRSDVREQDRKLWDVGIIDPLFNADDPYRPQIVKVVDKNTGAVLFEREAILPPPTQGAPVPWSGLAQGFPGVAHGNVAQPTVPAAQPSGAVADLIAKLAARPDLLEKLGALVAESERVESSPPIDDFDDEDEEGSGDGAATAASSPSPATGSPSAGASRPAGSRARAGVGKR